MLFKVEAENFYSIRDPQVIDLTAAGHAPEENSYLSPIWKGASQRGPKVVAIFGANASGKSTVLKVISFLAWFVRNSFGLGPEQRLPFERFNDSAAREKPARFAVHFAGIADLQQMGDPNAVQCHYVYELAVGGPSSKPQQVIYEALHYWPRGPGRRVRLFERDEKGKVRAGKVFQLTGFQQPLEKVLRPNASVISTLAQLQHPFSTHLWNAVALIFTNILVEKGDAAEPDMVRHYASNPELVETINREIERIDLGIKSLEIVSEEQGPTIRFTHAGLSVPMPLILQSNGTRMFLRLYPAIHYVLQTGGVAVLDEFDASIHPVTLLEILRWFRDPQRNPHDAQLWMSCHNASLLEHLTKEEILFCEKDAGGRTTVYGLSDIRAVRRDDNYYKKYLGGVYGAVPRVG